MVDAQWYIDHSTTSINEQREALVPNETTSVVPPPSNQTTNSYEKASVGPTINNHSKQTISKPSTLNRVQSASAAQTSLSLSSRTTSSSSRSRSVAPKSNTLGISHHHIPGTRRAKSTEPTSVYVGEELPGGTRLQVDVQAQQNPRVFDSRVDMQGLNRGRTASSREASSSEIRRFNQVPKNGAATISSSRATSREVDLSFCSFSYMVEEFNLLQLGWQPKETSPVRISRPGRGRQENPYRRIAHQDSTLDLLVTCCRAFCTTQIPQCLILLYLVVIGATTRTLFLTTYPHAHVQHLAHHYPPTFSSNALSFPFMNTSQRSYNNLCRYQYLFLAFAIIFAPLVVDVSNILFMAPESPVSLLEAASNSLSQSSDFLAVYDFTKTASEQIQQSGNTISKFFNSTSLNRFAHAPFECQSDREKLLDLQGSTIARLEELELAWVKFQNLDPETRHPDRTRLQQGYLRARRRLTEVKGDCEKVLECLGVASIEWASCQSIGHHTRQSNTLENELFGSVIGRFDWPSQIPATGSSIIIGQRLGVTRNQLHLLITRIIQEAESVSTSLLNDPCLSMRFGPKWSTTRFCVGDHAVAVDVLATLDSVVAAAHWIMPTFNLFVNHALAVSIKLERLQVLRSSSGSVSKSARYETGIGQPYFKEFLADCAALTSSTPSIQIPVKCPEHHSSALQGFYTAGKESLDKFLAQSKVHNIVREFQFGAFTASPSMSITATPMQF